MKKHLIYSILILFCLSSCNEITKSKTEREGEPDVHNVESSDLRMNTAILEANNSIDIFKEAVMSLNSDYEYFTLKQKFDTPDGGGEHIWIQEVTIRNSDYFGIIGNEPVNVNDISLGDSIMVDKEKISDWMFFDKGITRGGYTIKVLRDGMSEEERNQFDLQSGLIFE